MDTVISTVVASSTASFTSILSTNLVPIVLLGVGVLAFFWIKRQFRSATKGK